MPAVITAAERVKASRLRAKAKLAPADAAWLRDYDARRSPRNANAQPKEPPRSARNAASVDAGPGYGVVDHVAPATLIVHETKRFERTGDPMRYSWVPVAPPANDNADAPPEAIVDVVVQIDPERLARGADRFARVIRWCFRKGVDAMLEVAGEQLAAANGGQVKLDPETAAMVNEFVSNRGEFDEYVYGCAKRTAEKHNIHQLASLPYEDEIVTVGAGAGGGLLAALRFRQKLLAPKDPNAPAPAKAPPTAAPAAPRGAPPAAPVEDITAGVWSKP